jgi:hypothetical protein
MLEVNEHYTEEHLPVPVPFCIQAILMHVGKHGCCKYCPSAADELHEVPLPGCIHFLGELYRNDRSNMCKHNSYKENQKENQQQLAKTRPKTKMMTRIHNMLARTKDLHRKMRRE